MFKFANPEYLRLFILLPFLVGLFLYTLWKKHHSESKLGNREVLKQLVPLRSSTRPIVKFVWLMFAVIMAILLLARPQFETSSGMVNRKGIEAIFVLDVSQSMLAKDVSPSRIERSKLLISTIAEKMKEDKIGLAFFAGEAYPLLPITNDYVSIRFFLDNMTTDMVSLQGTNIAAAITLADKSFTQDEEAGKAIVIITDGEDHRTGAKEAAVAAAKNGRRVYILGVGSVEGAKIPTPEGWLTDNEGRIVKTSLNEKMCREIAEAGKGAYIHIDGSNLAQDRLEEELKKLQESDSEIADSETLNEEFQTVAILLLLLLLVELLVLEKKNPLFSRFKFFTK
ncbi:VWA domain-containing protein [Alloprevotella sp. OH1205_COT-284]|uniref:VWA domain-containing protein n=1 Tax=Alloprevotella sp. OH1205_COT-284 TaxID=2491043 RepID=UPI000F5FA1CE|nr:VWA domain-containing protein [Alloprevotella sp. OH1205_COT-284]RRD77024.1 VWA domain-containing protein [Alloprevotella sp. OH1205_COT-284]